VLSITTTTTGVKGEGCGVSFLVWFGLVCFVGYDKKKKGFSFLRQRFLKILSSLFNLFFLLLLSSAAALSFLGNDYDYDYDYDYDLIILFIFR
jgi:hypothetical protein